MGYLVFDTETNALQDFKRSADAEGQPRLAEFGAILLNDKFEIEGDYHRYIKPPSDEDGYEWQMSAEATAINRITNDVLEAAGVPVSYVLEWYSGQIAAGRAVVAFGAQFDCKTMRGELRRANRDDMFEQTKNVCLMRSARPFAKEIGRELIKAGGGNKGWPKLTDLATFLGIPFKVEELHGAMPDARLTTACFQRMVALGFKPEPAVHYSKNLEAIRSAT